MGIKTVITASPDDKQRELAKQCGLKYVEIPFGWFDMNAEHLQQFLQAVEAGPAPIYVSSRTGTLRAGILLAHWRIHAQKWSVEQALNEYYRLQANIFDAVHLVEVLKANAPQ